MIAKNLQLARIVSFPFILRDDMIHLEVLKGEVRVDRDIRVVIYVGFVPHVFSLCLEARKFPPRFKGRSYRQRYGWPE